ncbi:MAG TPA: hypothetical protein VK778_07650 [Solirubrobacteraceae bacterium]|jgi:hypothetical protein|nr:hypothetical protein [Solirubrobacteraceae bacterium]
MIAQRAVLSGEKSFSWRLDRTASRALEPGPLAMLAARVRVGSLNRSLIAHGDPAESRQLAARAQQLTSPRSRAALASDLDRLLWSAQAPAGRWRVPLHREAVCANASALGELAGLLASPTPLYAPGVAALEELLSDGLGPVYRGDGEALACRLGACRAAMTGGA